MHHPKNFVAGHHDFHRNTAFPTANGRNPKPGCGSIPFCRKTLFGPFPAGKKRFLPVPFPVEKAGSFPFPFPVEKPGSFPFLFQWKKPGSDEKTLPSPLWTKKGIKKDLRCRRSEKSVLFCFRSISPDSILPHFHLTVKSFFQFFQIFFVPPFRREKTAPRGTLSPVLAYPVFEVIDNVRHCR